MIFLFKAPWCFLRFWGYNSTVRFSQHESGWPCLTGSLWDVVCHEAIIASTCKTQLHHPSSDPILPFFLFLSFFKGKEKRNNEKVHLLVPFLGKGAAIHSGSISVIMRTGPQSKGSGPSHVKEEYLLTSKQRSEMNWFTVSCVHQQRWKIAYP